MLSARWGRLERQHAQLVRLCLHCGGGGGRMIAEGRVHLRVHGHGGAGLCSADQLEFGAKRQFALSVRIHRGACKRLCGHVELGSEETVGIDGRSLTIDGGGQGLRPLVVEAADKIRRPQAA